MQPFTFPTVRRAPIPALVLAAASFAACDNNRDSSVPSALSSGAASASVSPGVHRQYGVPVKVGNGRARAYVTLDAKGDTPLEFGIALDSTAMYGLPAPMGGGHSGHGDMHEYLVPLPPHAPAPYKFVELDWNPAGHGDPYAAPHFDFHFYTIDVAERNAIVPTDPKWATKAANFPAADYLRPNFICPCDILNIPPAEMAVPRMGMHFLDMNSPEFGGAPFTTTMINGTWDGKVIFQEPMITRAFIMSKTDTSITLPMAKRASPAGWYPAAYGTKYDAQAREYRIVLSNFKWLN